jgi:hypothetical protein
MKFIYYLACIGSKNLDKKLDILSANLNYIYNDIQCNFDIIVNCYDNYDVVYDYIQQFDFINDKWFYNKPGVLTELFLTNPHNARLSKYDYILFMLDDVKIQYMNINSMIALKQKYAIEILSPKVINSTHPFMYALPDNLLTFNNAVEIYSILLTYNDFMRFISLHTIENKWMWGADFLFGHYNIRAGVCFNYNVVHALPSDSDKSNARELMAKYLKKINYTGDIADVVTVTGAVNVE